MINNDVLRKFGIKYFDLDNRGLDSFISRTNREILRIKLGFQGIGNRHMSIIDSGQILRGYRIIIDDYIFNPEKPITYDEYSPKIFQIISSMNQGDNTFRGILLGIGNGMDLLGDPSRSLVIGKTYDLGDITSYDLVLKLDSMGRYKKFDKRS